MSEVQHADSIVAPTLSNAVDVPNSNADRKVQSRPPATTWKETCQESEFKSVDVLPKAAHATVSADSKAESKPPKKRAPSKPKPSVNDKDEVETISNEAVKSSKKKKLSIPISPEPKQGENVKNENIDKVEPYVMNAKDKKKYALLQEQVSEEQKKLQQVKEKLDALASKMTAVKWPIKDSLVLPKLIALEEKKPKKDQKPVSELQKQIPPPSIRLPLQDSDLAGDALACWDFLNVFSKHLELAYMSLDEFIELLQYRGQDSIAFVELFMAPLRILVKDEELSLKISLDVPFETNFARKTTASELQVGALGSIGRVGAGASTGNAKTQEALTIMSQVAGPLSVTQALADEYRSYCKPISLLPRRLRLDQVDPLRWQAVCTAMLPHLPPVRAFLKLSLEMQYLITDHAALRASKALTYDSTLSGHDLSTTSQRQREKEEKKIFEELQAARRRGKDSAEAIAQATSLLLQSNANHRSRDINIDSALCLTSDVTSQLSMLREAMRALQSDDLHKASTRVKLFVLKTLFKSCYETAAFREVITENAEKIISLTEERKREDLERVRVKRAGSRAVQDRAIALCREENRVALDEKTKKGAAKAAKAESSKGKSTTGESKSKGVKRTADGEEKEPECEKSAEASKAVASTAQEGNKGKRAPASKTGKSADPLAPGPAQLASKVEELMFLEEIGVNEIMDLGDDVLSDEDPEDETDTRASEGNNNRPRSGGAASRAADAAREERRKNINYRNDQRKNATEQLQLSLESERESDLRRSIKQGQRSELLQWEEEDGKVYCTQLMFQAQKKLADIEARKQAEKADAEFQRSLKQYTVRTEPLGFDRHGNSYWAFSGDEDRLYVCLRDTQTKSAGATDVLSLNGKMHVPKQSAQELFKADSAMKQLFTTRPFRETAECWQIYGSERELYFLWDSLDDRGTSERALKAKIKSSFEFSKPIEYRTDHEWIGRQIERVWPKSLRQKNSIGVIDGWLDEDEDEGDLALWHIQYIDGDAEELEEHEVRKFLISDDEKTDKEKQEARDLATAKRIAAEVDRRTSSRVNENNQKEAANKPASSISNKQEVDEDGTESEVEDDAPYVVLNYENKNVNRTYKHVVTKPGFFGFRGLKREMKSFLTVIETGLKSADMPLSKETKAGLHKSIESAAAVQDLRDALLSIEETIIAYACTDIVDLDDKEEALKEQQNLHDRMRMQGWRFEKTESTYIGKSARRFFLRTGASDGIVTGVHRSTDPKTNITEELFLVEHADGETDEMDEEGVRLAIRAYELNQMADVSAATREEMDDNDSDDSDEDEDYGYNLRDIEDMSAELDEQQDMMWTIEAEEDASVECIPRLWPTKGVRSKWLEALRGATCVADVAMAMSALHAQAVSFGVTGEDIFENMKEKAPHVIFRKPKVKVNEKRDRQRGKSGTSKSSDNRSRGKDVEEGRSSRRAASRGINYAED